VALTTEEQRLAAKWWILQVFKMPRKAAANSVPEILQMIQDADAWVDTAPGVEATNAASFAAAIDSAFKNRLSNAGFVVADALALSLAAIALARAGALPGQ
jgi:hypothetical protein